MKENIWSLVLTTLLMTGYQYSDFANTTSFEISGDSPMGILSNISDDSSEKETRSLPEFNSIDVSGGIKLIMEKGNKHEAEVEVENAKLEHLITEVKNGELRVYFKKNLLKWNNKQATINLTFTEVEALDASSGCYINCNSVIESNDFDLDVSSGCKVIFDLDVSILDADLSSGSSVTVSGKAQKLVLDASSGVSFGGGDLECDNVTIDASSGSSIKVWANNSLNVEASSGTTVKYKGNPTDVSIDDDISSTIKKIR